jgi:hypothetical protein
LLLEGLSGGDEGPIAALKDRVVGDTEIDGVAATPVPERLTAVEPPAALWVMVKVPERAPVAVGVNPAFTVQVAPAAIDAPLAQVPPVTTAKSPLAAMVPITRAALPPFDSVTVWAVPATPTVRLPNDSEVGDALAVGAGAAVPVPVKPTASVPPAALCVMFSVPDRAPAALGLKLTETVQLPPAVTDPPAEQVPPATTKSVEVMLMPDRLSAALPVLLTVTLWAVVVTPTVVEAKLNEVGDTAATGAAAPPVATPDKAKTIGVDVRLCDRVSVPVRVPVAVGEKVTNTVQLAPTPSVVPQVPPERENSALVVTAMALRFKLGLARTVMVCAALVLPTAVEAKLSLVGLLAR